MGLQNEDLTFDLGLSIWLRRSGRSVEEACDLLHGLRSALLATTPLDATTEPVPMVGRDARRDVVTLARYIVGLCARATAASACRITDLAEQVVLSLPEDERVELGA